MGLTSLEDTVKYQAKKRNNTHFMLVDGMSKLMAEKIKKCDSLDFHAFGLKWKLCIRSDVEEDYLSFFLHIIDDKCIGCRWGVKCSFKLGVVSQNAAPDICMPLELYFDSEHDSWGATTIISQEELKENCLVNDKAVFYAEITGVKPRFLNVTSIPRTMGTAERLTLMEVPRNNSRFTWKITKFSSFDGENHLSYEFTAGPRRWYLEMYPKGYSEAAGNSLSLFLHPSDFVSNVPAKATSAIYKLRVLDQLKRNHHEYEVERLFTTDKDPWGFIKFLALEELHNPSNGFLVNDMIYIGVEFLFLSPHEYL